MEYHIYIICMCVFRINFPCIWRQRSRSDPSHHSCPVWPIIIFSRKTLVRDIFMLFVHNGMKPKNARGRTDGVPPSSWAGHSKETTKKKRSAGHKF